MKGMIINMKKTLALLAALLIAGTRTIAVSAADYSCSLGESKTYDCYTQGSCSSTNQYTNTTTNSSPGSSGGTGEHWDASQEWGQYPAHTQPQSRAYKTQNGNGHFTFTQQFDVPVSDIDAFADSRLSTDENNEEDEDDDNSGYHQHGSTDTIINPNSSSINWLYNRGNYVTDSYGVPIRNYQQNDPLRMRNEEGVGNFLFGNNPMVYVDGEVDEGRAYDTDPSVRVSNNKRSDYLKSGVRTYNSLNNFFRNATPSQKHKAKSLLIDALSKYGNANSMLQHQGFSQAQINGIINSLTNSNANTMAFNFGYNPQLINNWKNRITTYMHHHTGSNEYFNLFNFFNNNSSMFKTFANNIVKGGVRDAYTYEDRYKTVKQMCKMYTNSGTTHAKVVRVVDYKVSQMCIDQLENKEAMNNYKWLIQKIYDDGSIGQFGTQYTITNHLTHAFSEAGNYLLSSEQQVFKTTQSSLRMEIMEYTILADTGMVLDCQQHFTDYNIQTKTNTRRTEHWVVATPHPYEITVSEAMVNEVVGLDGRVRHYHFNTARIK